jgi:pyridoxine 4-dehydrogenase
LYDDLLTTPDYEQLLAVMKDVAADHSNANLPQVALNWARAKGTVPIPGARTLSQAQSNFAALDWTLSKEEVQILDRAAAKVTTFIKPEANPFPRKDKDSGLIMYDS